MDLKENYREKFIEQVTTDIEIMYDGRITDEEMLNDEHFIALNQFIDNYEEAYGKIKPEGTLYDRAREFYAHNVLKLDTGLQLNEYGRELFKLKNQLLQHVKLMTGNIDLANKIPPQLYDITITFGGQSFNLMLNADLYEGLNHVFGEQLNEFGYNK